MQKVAIENHCRLAGETTHPRFCTNLAGGWRVVLTLNSGYE